MLVLALVFDTTSSVLDFVGLVSTNLNSFPSKCVALNAPNRDKSAVLNR